LFFRELREFFQRLLFISGTDTREPFSWDRTKKLLGIFWKQYKKRIFPEDEEEEDEEVEGELEGPANAGLIEEGGTV